MPKSRCPAVERRLTSYQKFRKLKQEWVDLEIEPCKLKPNLETEDNQLGTRFSPALFIKEHRHETHDERRPSTAGIRGGAVWC